MTDTTASLKKKLILTTAFVGAFFGYNGRRAYAACAYGSGTYLCTGANAVTQSIDAYDQDLIISTAPGFSVTADPGNGITINGDTVDFTDANASVISAVNGTGIKVMSGSNGGSGLDMDLDSVITGQSGIDARNQAGGDLKITFDGDITATTGRGILAFNYVNTDDVDITLGVNSSITAADKAIHAQNSGTGGITITANGDISANQMAIYAYGRTSNTEDLIITTGVGTSIVGGQRGIHVFSSGSGNLIVTAHGDVEGTNFIGISAYSQNAGDLTVTTDAGTTIMGSSHGIRAASYGTGALSVTANGIVTGTDDYGIYARGYGPSVDVTTGASSDVTGGAYGLKAFNYGGGAMTITINGDLTSTAGMGIYALGYYDYSTDLTISTGTGSSVTGDSKGIYALHNGSGDLSITANGDVTGTSEQGIAAYVSATGGGMSITTGAASNISGTVGIFAENKGTGSTTIIANGDVTGTSTRGISAYVSATGDSLSITTGALSKVSGTTQGIYAENKGTGGITITTNGSVSGQQGIEVRNENGGDLTITANGDVTGTNTFAISAFNVDADTDSVSVTLGAGSNIEGNTDAVTVENRGTGSLTVIANSDTIVATTGMGIEAINETSSTGDLAVTVGADTEITADTRGISAWTKGSGKTTVTVNGTINAGDWGVYGLAQSSSDAGDLTISTGALSSVTGGQYGLMAFNNTDSGLEINVAGDVTATTRDGIYVAGFDNYGTGVKITTSGTSEVLGQRDGIRVSNYSYDAGMTIDIGGASVTGTTRHGVYARNVYQTLFTLDVQEGSEVTGNNDGIYAYSGGDAAITIDGDVNSGNGNGLFVYATSSAGYTTITTGKNATIEGDTNGIEVQNGGSGALTVSNSGTITGDTGILVNDGGDAAGSITNTSTGKIEGTGGTAISLTNLDAAMEIKINGGQIIGDVVDDTPGNGFSTVTIGGSFTSAGDFDVSDFNVSSGKTFTFGAGDKITSDSTVDVDGIMTVSAAGSSIVGAIDVNSGGKLNVGAAFAVSDELTNAGTVAIAAGKTLTIDTMGTATGTLDFGISSAADHAQLTINSGAADLTGQTITINVSASNTLVAGTYIKLIDGTTAIVGGPGATETAVTDNSGLWNFKIVDGTVGGTNNTDLFVTPTLTSSATTPGATALINLNGVTSDPDLITVITALNNATTPEEVAQIIESTQPTVNGSTVTVTLASGDAVGSLQNQQIAAIRSGEESGMAAGVSGHGVNMWAQGFGQAATQDTRDGIKGFNAGTAGVAVGVDTVNLVKNAILGLTFNYAKTNVNAKNVNTTGTDINSFGVGFYSSYNIKNTKAFVNAQLAYAYNAIESARHNAAGLGVTAASEYHSDQASAKLAFGYDYHPTETFVLTPSLYTSYTFVANDGYTETGAGGANLNVKSDVTQALNLGLDMNASWKIRVRDDGSIVRPSLHFGYAYDAIGDAIQTTASFTGGGAAFTTNGPSPARSSINGGLGLSYLSGSGWSFALNYGYDYKADYGAHNGTARVTLPF